MIEIPHNTSQNCHSQVRLLVRRRSPETDHVFHSILAMRDDGASTSLGGAASTISSRDAPPSQTSFPLFDGDEEEEEELRDAGDWSFLSGSEDLPPPPPIPRGLNLSLSQKSHGSHSSDRIRDKQRGKGQSRKHEDENRDGAILNGNGGGAVFDATRSRRTRENSNEESRKLAADSNLKSDQKRNDSSASRQFSFRSNQKTSAADQFSFSPLGAPTHRQNPLHHDSRTGIDVNVPYYHHHHRSSSSTIHRPLGLIPFAKILPSLRRLGFDISKSSPEALAAELDAVDGFSAEDRSLVDADKCFKAAKRVFRGKTVTEKEDSGSRTKSGAERRRSESFTDREESTAPLSKHKISGEKRFNSLKERNSSRQRRNLDELTDLVPCTSSSPSPDVRAMSKLLSECRDERDAARIDVAKWMLRTEELESSVHQLSKEAKDAKILGADAVAENKELKKRLKVKSCQPQNPAQFTFSAS